MIPQSQTGRPIGFALYDANRSNLVAQHQFTIRPEELTVTDPSRMATHQSIGGAWVDDFGRGLVSISISGTTGWRGTQDKDGLQLFQDLYETAFKRWHSLRAERAQRGINPDNVQLIFSDEMDGVSYVVAPERFVLRRSKQKPLLATYQIQMTGLAEVADYRLPVRDPIRDAINNPRGRYRAASEALKANVERQKELAKSVDGALGGLSGAVNSIMEKSEELLTAAMEIADEVTGTFDAVTAPILYAAVTLQKAARNAFQVMTLHLAVAEHIKAGLMEISANFHGAYCTLVNGFNLIGDIPDFSDLFGASNCSSTGGGRPASPYANGNPFMAMFEPGQAPVGVTEDAATAAEELSVDPLATESADGVGERMQALADGVTLQ